MVFEISLTWLITALIDAIAATAALVSAWMASILPPMSLVALAVPLASSLTVT